jgi:ribosomal protein S16
MAQNFKNSLASQFDFGERKEADMIYDDPTPTFRDPILGRNTRFDALQRDSFQYPSRTYYQTGKNPQDFLMCGGRAFAPQKRFVKPMNEGTRDIRPISQVGRYEPLPIPLRQVLEPNVGISFGEPDTIPNYQQKFIPKKTPMEELTRNFLSQSIDKMKTDQTRVDRDKVIQMLQGLGLFDSSDANKPLSALIEKANANLPPESQLPIVNETLANLEKGRGNQATNQNARDARAIEEMRTHNNSNQLPSERLNKFNPPAPPRPDRRPPSPPPRPREERGRTPFSNRTNQILRRQQLTPPTQMFRSPMSREPSSDTKINLNQAFQGVATGSAGNIVPASNQTESGAGASASQSQQVEELPRIEDMTQTDLVTTLPLNTLVNEAIKRGFDESVYRKQDGDFRTKGEIAKKFRSAILEKQKK